MTEKDLIKKLNNLQNVQPDSDWKKNHRAVLLSQISNTSGAGEISAWSNFWMLTKNLLSTVYQPALVAMSIVVVVLGGLVFGHKLMFVKPGNSLYIAKIISERAHLNTILDTGEKNKMEVRFASNHAKDIASVLADPEFNNDQNQTEVARLNSDFKSELTKVRNSLVATDQETKIDDGQVFSADAEKVNEGLSLYDPKANHDATSVIATTSSEATTTATSTPKVEVKKDANQILEEAEKLFDQKNYVGALDKLREADEIIK